MTKRIFCLGLFVHFVLCYGQIPVLDLDGIIDTSYVDSLAYHLYGENLDKALGKYVEARDGFIKMQINKRYIQYNRINFAKSDHVFFNQKNGLQSVRINDLEIAEDGTLWLSTNVGLSQYDGESFKNYNLSTNGELSDPLMHYLHISNDTIYISHRRAYSISIFKDGKFCQVPDKSIPYKIKKTFAYKYIGRDRHTDQVMISAYLNTGLYQYIAVKNIGLYVIANPPWKAFKKKIVKDPLFPYDIMPTFQNGVYTVNSIYEGLLLSKSNGEQIIIPSKNLHISYINLSNTDLFFGLRFENRLYHIRNWKSGFEQKNFKIDTLNLPLIYCATTHSDGFTYFGSTEGLYQYNGQEFTKVDSTVKNIRNMASADGGLILASYGDGLYWKKDHQASQKFTYLPENYWSRIVIDSTYKRYWFVGNQYAMVCEQDSLRKYTYNVKMNYFGVPEIEGRNSLWGDIKGDTYTYLAVTNPANPDSQSYVSLDFNLYKPDTSQIKVKIKPIPPSHQNNGILSISYHGINTTGRIDRIQYSYRLRGVSDWVYAGNNTTAQFVNVPRGEYIFEVKACNSHGVWPKNSSQVQITVDIPFYKTTLFYLIFALISALCIWGIYSLRLRQIKKNESRLKAMVEESAQKLVLAQKMSTMGEVSANLIHEIKNPLNYMGMLAQLLTEEIQSDIDKEKLVHFCKGINLSVQRLSELVDALRIFYRKEEGKRQRKSIVGIVYESIELLSPKLNEKHISIDVKKSDVPPICSIKSITRQIITNVIDNAIDASEPYNKIDIMIELDNGYVLVAIKDYGKGISQELHHKIFNPFFTTKSPEYGMGLGLSLSYKMMEHHRGSIEFHSSSSGTIFRLLFPVAK